MLPTKEEWDAWNQEEANKKKAAVKSPLADNQYGVKLSLEDFDQIAKPVQQDDSGDFMRGAKTAFKQVPSVGVGGSRWRGGGGWKVPSEKEVLLRRFGKEALRAIRSGGQDIAKDAKDTDEFFHRMGKDQGGRSRRRLAQHGLGYAAGQGIQPACHGRAWRQSPKALVRVRLKRCRTHDCQGNGETGCATGRKEDRQRRT